MPNAPQPSLAQDVEKKLGVFFTAHHLVLYALLILSFVGCVYLVESKVAALETAKAEAATRVAEQAKQDAVSAAKQNQDFQAKVEQEIAQLQAANQALSAANNKLTAAIVAESNALASQQKKDQSMTPTEQSTRWQQLVPKASVQPTPTGFSIDAAGGLATIEQLEQVPVQAEQIDQLRTQLTNDNQTVLNLNTELTDERNSHASDIKTDQMALKANQDQTLAAQADLKAEKAKARKGKLKWFGIGYVAGFLTAEGIRL